MKGGTRAREESLLTRVVGVGPGSDASWAQPGLPLALGALSTPSVFLSFFLYSTLSFPLSFPGKTPWKSSNFGL